MSLMIGVQEQDQVIFTKDGETATITYCYHNGCWRLVIDAPPSWKIDRGDREEAKARRCQAKIQRGASGN